MKKRFLLILAFGIAFAPAVFADGLGQMDRASQIGGDAITCSHAQQDKAFSSYDSENQDNKSKPAATLAN